MYRSKTIHTLLAIWLFAVIAPPVISLVNSEERVYISFNQNEEEQEQGKKDNSEEKIVQESLDHSEFIALSNSSNFNLETLNKVPPHFLEIPSPPPEQKV